MRAVHARRVRFRNPLVRVRDTKAAARAAYIGGFLLFVTGSTGAVAVVKLGYRLVMFVSPGAAEVLTPLFLIVGLAAALGGLTVVVAGYVLTRHRGTGKALLWLGSGVGLVTFLAHCVVITLAGRDILTDILASAVTAQGMAVLVVLYAQLRA